MGALVEYLASPFASEDARTMELRAKAAAFAAGRLIASGVPAFSPIAHNKAAIEAAGLPAGWAAWGAFDEAMLKACGALAVLELPGWEASKGVAEEIKIAHRLGLPIRRIDPRSIDGGSEWACLLAELGMDPERDLPGV